MQWYGKNRGSERVTKGNDKEVMFAELEAKVTLEGIQKTQTTTKLSSIYDVRPSPSFLALSRKSSVL